MELFWAFYEESKKWHQACLVSDQWLLPLHATGRQDAKYWSQKGDLLLTTLYLSQLSAGSLLCLFGTRASQRCLSDIPLLVSAPSIPYVRKTDYHQADLWPRDNQL